MINHTTFVYTCCTKRKKMRRRIQRHCRKVFFCHQEALHAPPKVCGRLQRAGVRKAHVINFLKLNNIKLIWKNVYAIDYPDNYQKTNVKRPKGPQPYGLIFYLKGILVNSLHINKQNTYLALHARFIKFLFYR